MIPLVWTKNLKGQSKKDFEIVLRNSTLVTSRLKEILQERRKTLEKYQDYDSASWSHKQAHQNGRQEELDFLLSILNLKEP